jgi:UDP-N-acetylmuramoyl-tripeptide--D-alanyl-D-alanine ligase
MENLFDLFYETSGVCTDTRNILHHCLFIALKGENFNGNDFAQQSIQQGAKYAIVDEIDKADNQQIFFVKNSLYFLQMLGRHHRRKFNIPIIGITGSNGKTTSKELIACVLEQKYAVLCTKGNLNNHIGVPLTLLRLKKEHEIAVIEMGANKPGDIDELCTIAEPNFGIITNIGSAHLEGFGSLAGVVQTKTALFRSIQKSSGTIIANADDEIITKQLPKNVDTYFYSNKDAGAFVFGKLNLQNLFVHFSWSSEKYQSPIIASHLVGKYNFYNFLAAISFGKLFQVDNDAINQAIEKYTPTNNRSQIEKTAKNTLIVDCYNANPTSMQAALDSFAMVEAAQKTVILGDMLELGDFSYDAHQKIIQFLEKNTWQKLIVGTLFKQFEPQKDMLFFENVAELNAYIAQNGIEKKLILIKGSRGIKLESAIQFL